MAKNSYGPTHGEISSPAGDLVVKSLTRKTGNSIPVNHNLHPSLGSGNGSIKSPLNDSIVPANSVGKGGFKEQK